MRLEDSGGKRLVILLGLLVLSLLALVLTVGWQERWFDLATDHEMPLVAKNNKEAVRKLVEQHPDPQISKDLRQEWDRGLIWVQSADLPKGRAAEFRDLTAHDAFVRYRKHSSESLQTVLMVSSREIKAAQVSVAARKKLEADLLKEYEGFVNEVAK